MHKSILLLAVIALVVSTAAFSDQPVPSAKSVTLNVTGTAVPITNALDMLAKQTSIPIVYDYTVKGKLGDSHISLPSLGVGVRISQS